jgi:hypothetical protein
MSNRKQLLDLHVFGKGMATVVEAHSPLIGEYVKANANMAYGDIQYVAIPESVCQWHPSMERIGQRVKMTHLSKEDERTPGFNYGYLAANNRGAGLFDRVFTGSGSRGNGAMPNNTLFMIPGLEDGFKLTIPKFLGQAKVDEYVRDMREEAQLFFNWFLRPAERRVKIYIEDYRTQ